MAWDTKSQATKEWQRAKKRTDLSENQRSDIRMARINARKQFQEVASNAKRKDGKSLSAQLRLTKLLANSGVSMDNERSGKMHCQKEYKDEHGQALTSD